MMTDYYVKKHLSDSRLMNSKITPRFRHWLAKLYATFKDRGPEQQNKIPDSFTNCGLKNNVIDFFTQSISFQQKVIFSSKSIEGTPIFLFHALSIRSKMGVIWEKNKRPENYGFEIHPINPASSE